MISAESAIHRIRRDLTVSTLLKTALVGVTFVAFVVGPVYGGVFDGSIILLIVGILWLVLSYRSVRGSRIAAASPSLIASGQYDAAEQRIVAAMHSFSLFRTVKLLTLHHLALLRHAQQRWQETVMLCRALLRQRLGPAAGLGKSTHLILAEALLELGDLSGAHDCLLGLYDQRLTLGEAIRLQSVQLDYLSRVGAWDQMLQEVQTKIQLAELMPADGAARVQALLALAARRLGRDDLSTWLRRRVELLADPAELSRRRPILAELWRLEEAGRL